MTRLIRTAAIALAFVTIGLSARAETVEHLVFNAHLLEDVREPAMLRYRFEVSGSLMGEPYEDEVLMDVREVAPDGAKVVHFDLFRDSPRRRQVGPVDAKLQNPLIIIFLQRDVAQMGNLTGGSPQYFRNQIRKAFMADVPAEPVEFELDGRTVQGQRIAIEPFKSDPNIGRFRQFQFKRYTFTVSDAVPGGLFEIATVTPETEEGTTALEESMTFVGVDQHPEQVQ